MKMSNIESQDLLSHLKQLNNEIIERSEMDFRYSFGILILERWLGWKRQSGKGHFVIEKARKDILMYDDSQPPLIVAVIETKKPDHTLDLIDIEQLKAYLEEVGTAKWAILTNGRKLVLYSFVNREMRLDISLDLEVISQHEEISSTTIADIDHLEVLRQDRFTNFSDIEYFNKKFSDVELIYERGSRDIAYPLFMTSLRKSLDELTECFEHLFSEYQIRQTKSGRFLRYAFNEWRRWRAFTGKRDKPEHYFCRETAYILVNRVLFARICEDKRLLTKQYLSGNGMARMLDEGLRHPYIIALENVERILRESYERIYGINIFDWWQIDPSESSQASDDDQEKQMAYNDQLNDALKYSLKR